MDPWRGGSPSEATGWRCGQRGTIARGGPEVACKLQSAHACQSRAHIAKSKTAAPSQNARTGPGVGLGAVIPETQYAYSHECLLQAEHLALETSSTHHSHVVYDAAHRCGAATCLRGRGVPSMPSGAGGAGVRLSAAGAVPCVHPCPVWGVTVIQRLDQRQQAAGPAYSKN